MLHDVIAWHKVDHLRAELGGQRFDQLILPVGLAAVADQPCEPHAAGIGVLHDSFGDVVGRIHGHHFAGDDDVDFLRLVLADRHGKTAAHHITEHVVENKVQVFVVSALFLKEVDGGDDAATGTANPGLRTTGLDALDAAVADGQYILELQVFDRTRFRRQVHDRVLSLAVQDQAGRVGFRVTANDHDLLTGLGQRGDQILGRRRFPDASLAIDGCLP